MYWRNFKKSDIKGEKGDAGIGFKLTDTGDFDIQHKRLVNVGDNKDTKDAVNANFFRSFATNINTELNSLQAKVQNFYTAIDKIKDLSIHPKNKSTKYAALALETKLIPNLANNINFSRDNTVDFLERTDNHLFKFKITGFFRIELIFQQTFTEKMHIKFGLNNSIIKTIIWPDDIGLIEPNDYISTIFYHEICDDEIFYIVIDEIPMRLGSKSEVNTDDDFLHLNNASVIIEQIF